MKQIGRNAIDGLDGFLLGKRYVLMDRDTKFCEGFRDILSAVGVKAVRLPPQSPNLNAYLERFMRTVKAECLNRMIFFGETGLHRTIDEFVSHYHGERNHQGLGNRLIEAGPEVGSPVGAIRCRRRLGGMLRYYYRAA
jgi:transposase InsO family protein